MKVILKNSSLVFQRKKVVAKQLVLTADNITTITNAVVKDKCVVAYNKYSTGNYNYAAESAVNAQKSINFINIPSGVKKIRIEGIFSKEISDVFKQMYCLLLKNGYELSSNFSYGWLEKQYAAGEYSFGPDYGAEPIATGATYNIIEVGDTSRGGVIELTNVNSEAKFLCFSAYSTSALPWKVVIDYEE